MGGNAILTHKTYKSLFPMIPFKWINQNIIKQNETHDLPKFML